MRLFPLISLLVAVDAHALSRTPAAPWWTPERTPAALASLALAMGLAGGWVLTLRRQLRRQTGLARQKLQLETALEERYRDLVENATDLVFTVDMQAVILGANHAAEQIFGLSESDTAGRSLYEFIAAEECRAFNDVLALLMGGERTVLRQVRIASVDGRMFVVEMNCRVRHVDGNPTYVEIIGRDVTQQKLEQAALEEARAAAEAANRAKSDFLANMSHEIRTPMNGIIGMTELTLQGSLHHDQRANLEIVRTSAEALVTIINDILDFSKTEVGNRELDRAPLEILPLVESCVDIIGLQAVEKNLELVCDVDPLLPREWIGDAPRLRQVLVNLLGNAAKFTHAGEIVIRVEKTEMLDGKTAACFTVRDTGIGIPAEHHQRIFEMFSQADGSFSRKYGGTGLGLAIASRQVSLMGGRLSVESTPDVGSSFQFTLIVESSGEESIFPPNRLIGKSAVVCIRNAAARVAVARMLLHAGVTIVETEPASVVIADDAEVSANSAVIYLSLAGARSQEYPREATVLRAPVTPRKLLAAIDTITGSSASILALQKQSMSANLHNGTESPVGPGTILLAEDNKVNQMLAVRTLEKSGYRVVVANNGIEAVDLMRRVNADLVLMDIQMPEMDGFEATAQIREWSSVPVIAMTAHALKGDRERCLSGGMTDYIPKPVRPAALLHIVEQYIASGAA